MRRESPVSPSSPQKPPKRGQVVFALSRFFDAEIKARGAAYFRRGAVEVTEATECLITAEVRGTSLYSVGIQLTTHGTANLWCSCPYVERYELPCKHLWALVQTADTQTRLEALGTNRVTSVRLAGSATEFEQDARIEDERMDDLLSSLAESVANETLVAEDGGFDNAREPSLARQLGIQLGVDVSRAMLRRNAAPESHRSVPQQPRVGAQRGPHVAPEPDPSVHDEILCVIDPEAVNETGELFFDLWLKRQGGRFQRLTRSLLAEAKLGPTDTWVLERLDDDFGYYAHDVPLSAEPDSIALIKRLCREKRLVYASSRHVTLTQARLRQAAPVAFDGGGLFRLRLEATPANGGLLVQSKLVRSKSVRSKGDRNKNVRSKDDQNKGTREEVRALQEVMFAADGIIGFPDRLARLEEDAWLSLRQFWGEPEFGIAAEEVEDFLDLYCSPSAAVDLELPASIRLEPAETRPVPCLTVAADDRSKQLEAFVELQYGERRIPLPHLADRVVDLAAGKIHTFDESVQRSVFDLLGKLGFKGHILHEPAFSFLGPAEPEPLRIAGKRLPAAIDRLLREGFRVEAHGKIYRRPGQFNLSVSSGKDWLELEGGVDFDGERLGLPELLRAVRRGKNTVELGDGTLGVLPDAWLARLGMLSETETEDRSSADAVRVPRAQLMLVDEVLTHETGVSVDQAYIRLKQELEQSVDLEPASPPSGFNGELRDYQREGLAWLQRIGRLGFGACLADDMGLGKTVQVLALLLSKNQSSERPPPSLVVAPSSVVFNWVEEARRFTPSLRVVAYAGADRPRLKTALAEADVIVTSYNLIRSEAKAFAAASFDYLVLDEAQAIKNYATATAKAARALKASHRLTITGTPIENHLGELAAQLEFLNPGMLSASPRLYRALLAGRASTENLALVQRAVRPFLLRRTKQQVARELPERIEKTLYVELEGAERRRYDELLVHYRDRIQKNVQKLGLSRSTPQILEALLRLRQAACHPGLVDARLRAEPSAKLDRLLAELEPILERGEKSLIFSQFTSLLAIVKARLEARGIRYEYLDGATQNRKARVLNFQGSNSVSVFLISLKAGGVGLNLTAAEHVFLLDPWWNPAVEAQAIDRTHRIGQTRNILAYRLIARRTVEEKVVELQREKRQLAQAILGEDAGIGAKLTREDLEALLD